MISFRKALALAALGSTLLAAEARAETITLALGVDPAFTAIYVAQERGLFQKAGLDIKFMRVSQGGDAMDAVVAGQAQLAIAADQTAMIRLPRADIKPIGIISESGKFLEAVVRPGINGVKDIKKIGIVKGTVSEYSAMMMLRNAKIEKSTVEFISSSGPEMPALLLRGDIDAFFVWPPFTEQAKKQGAKMLMDSGTAGYVYTMWINASGPWLATHADDAKKVLKVISEVNRDISTNLSVAAADFQKATKMPASDTLPLMEKLTFKMRDFSDADLTSFETIADYLYAEKRTPQRVEVTKSLQRGFFKE
jgi:NitT/TauT family transport system substrate-binding protein